MRTKGSKNKAWSPRGNGKLLTREYLIQAYLMEKKNTGVIARETGCSTVTIKKRLVEFGIYQGDTRKTSSGFKRVGYNTAVQQAQVISPLNVPMPVQQERTVEQSVEKEPTFDERVAMLREAARQKKMEQMQ